MRRTASWGVATKHATPARRGVMLGFTDDDGKSHEVYGMIHSEGLSISGPKWKDWVPGAAASDAEYVAGLALKQLGLEAAPSGE